MTKQATILSVILIICLTSLHLVFALKTNAFFSLDDFALLNYLQNHSTKDMVLTFLSKGDIWGFKKILGYLNFSMVHSLFGVNPTAYIVNNFLLHTTNVLLVFLLCKTLTKDIFKSLFVSVIANSLYLTYFSNVHEYLVTTFVLASAFTYFRFPEKKHLSLLFFLLSLLTKEIAFTLPFLLSALSISKQEKNTLKPYWIALAFFIFYQLFVSQTGFTFSSDHPYATKLSLQVLWANLTFYLPPWLLPLGLITSVITKKRRPLPIYLVFVLSLLPFLILLNRRELYYLYLPTFYLAIYLACLLPKFTPKSYLVYILVFFLLGGRAILPSLPKQTYPNWQKISIQEVVNRVETKTDINEIDLGNINLERDARLMLESDTINLFVSPLVSSRLDFEYNSDRQTILVSRK